MEDCFLKAGDSDRLPDVVSRIPLVILTVFLACILTASMFWRAEYCSYRHGDSPAWISQNVLLLLVTAGVIFCVSLGIYGLCSELNHRSKNLAAGNILYLSFAVQVLYVILIPTEQFADQKTVNVIAQEVINGKFGAFRRGGYLYQYPNNIGIVLMLSLVYRLFPRSMLVPKILNAVFSTITSYLVIRIYEESDPARRNRSLSILVYSGFFLPVILLNNLVYNDIYATTLFTAAVYYAVRFSRSQRWKHLLLCGLFIAAGDFVRKLGVIFLIAVTLFLFIQGTKPGKIFAFMGMTILLFRLPLICVNGWLLGNGIITEPVGMNSVPIHMWIHMGMNDKKFGYWDDGYSYGIYLREGRQNKAQSAQIYYGLIRNRLRGNNLIKTLGVYVTKNFWLWTEGTYQAEYYGIGNWGYLYPTFFSGLLADSQETRDVLRWIMHADNFLILLVSLYGLVTALRDKKYFTVILPSIIILGFIGFYTLWEIKPRYIYPAYPYLMLLFNYGMNRLVPHFLKGTEYLEDSVLLAEETLVYRE